MGLSSVFIVQTLVMIFHNKWLCLLELGVKNRSVGYLEKVTESKEFSDLSGWGWRLY